MRVRTRGWTHALALGAMLFEILSGQPTRHCRTLAELLLRLDELPPQPPGPWGTLAVRCLAPEPQARPRDAGELLAILERLRA